MATLAVLLSLGAFAPAPVSAAITHEYLPSLSAKLSEGVPKGCGTGAKEPPEGPCLSGPLTGVNAITVDGGDVWLAELISAGGGVSHARVDRFEDKAGVFLGPQLDEGEGAGQVFGALAVGHGFSGKQVYVQESGGLIAVFDGETGKHLGTWSGEHTANGAPFGELGLAVDDSTAMSDSNQGDVFIATKSRERQALNVVDAFDPSPPAKAGEEPGKPVTELEGTCPHEDEVVGGTGCAVGGGLIPFKFPRRVAVSPLNGDVVVADGLPGPCEKQPDEKLCALDVFEPGTVPGEYRFLRAITQANGVPLTSFAGVTVNGEGDIYVAEPHVVFEFGPEGAYLGQIEGAPDEPFVNIVGLGVDPATDNVFVADGGARVLSKVFGKGIVIPDVNTMPASEVRATSATVNGTVKLDGVGPAECVFEYGTSEAYGKTAKCEPGEVEESEEVPAGTPVPVKATIGLSPEEELQPDATYYYRVRAVNSNGVPSEGEGSEDKGDFTTTGPGLLGQEASSEVSATAANLDGAIDPHGLPTSYYFQYNETGTGVCEAQPSDCTSVPAAPEAIGSASTPEGVSFAQHVQSLRPGHTYHYRLVVLSEPKHGETEVFAEPDRTFTTQPAGSGFELPDGRRWELVSPPDKHGAVIGGISEEEALAGAQSGGAIAYPASNPTEGGAPGFVQGEQLFSVRSASGWSTRSISLPHVLPPALSPGYPKDYVFFSEDLSLGLAQPYGHFTSLQPFVFPPDSEPTPYLRHDLSCESAPGTCYEPLVRGCPAQPAPCEPLLREDADVKAGTVFGFTENSEGVTNTNGVQFAGASPELSRVIVSSFWPLKEGAPRGALYEFSADAPFGEEQLQPVSVLPQSEGGAMVAGELGVPGELSARWAVSAGGARVVWTPEGRGLYLSDMSAGRAQSVKLGGSEATFQIANSEGSRVFYTEKGDLYLCEVSEAAGEPACATTDLTPAAGVQEEVLGASVDGSYVYYVAGGNRLYVLHYDEATRAWQAPVFIAALSSDDSREWGSLFEGHTSRVSANGRWLAFMSDRSLTGYDNRDARSGKPDEEVFLYSASGARLVCASCDPTGARPDGVEVTDREPTKALGLRSMFAAGTWVAANVPGWTSFTKGMSRYQSRFLSDEGRLFFNSSDALVPQAVNHNEDVYEFEPGEGGGPESAPEPPPQDSCTTSSPTYDPASGGCVSLISSGASPDESAFLDASENGSDVFFVTAERLVPQDLDSAYDVYDAHACSMQSPCTSAATSPPPCETAEACRAASAPQPQIFGSGPTETFSGPGNVSPPPAVTAKAETKAEKLSKALKACRRDRSKTKRAACEKAARKRYGAKPKTSAKKSSHHRGGKR